MFYLNQNQTIDVDSEFGSYYKFKKNDCIFEFIILPESTKRFYITLYLSIKDLGLRRQIFDFSDYKEKEFLFDMKNDLKKMMAEEKRVRTLKALDELNELSLIKLEKEGYLIKRITLTHPNKWKKNFKPEMNKNFLDYEYN